MPAIEIGTTGVQWRGSDGVQGLPCESTPCSLSWRVPDEVRLSRQRMPQGHGRIFSGGCIYFRVHVEDHGNFQPEGRALVNFTGQANGASEHDSQILADGQAKTCA